MSNQSPSGHSGLFSKPILNDPVFFRLNYFDGNGGPFVLLILFQGMNGLPPGGIIALFWDRLLAVRAHEFRLADGALLAQLGPAANLTGLFVMLALAKLLGQAAPLQQFLEAAQGGADRFPV